MTGLVKNLYQNLDEDSFTDVTFLLPDGSQLKAHKVILALASPVFEAQFFGPLAQKGLDEVNVRDVDGDTFRRVIQFIYIAEDMYGYANADTEDQWRLLEAAHLYILPDLIDLCQNKLCHILHNLKISKDLIKALNDMPHTTISEEVMKKGIDYILQNLEELLDNKIRKIS